MVPNYTNLIKSFFNDHAHEYDLGTNEGCGEFTIAFKRMAEKIDPRIKLLKKNPGQTQYKGVANDAILYIDEPSGMNFAVDIIGRAEQPHPWKSEGGNNDNPEGQWSLDSERRYPANYGIDNPINNSIPVPTPAPTTNPFPSYNSLGDDAFWRNEIGAAITADYAEAKQEMNDGSFVWMAQTMYDAMYYIVVEGLTPKSAADRSRNKHRPLWRAALGLS